MPSKEKQNILVVEDDEAMMNFLEISLQREGFNTIATNDGSKALDIFKEYNNFDLIITDIVLPGIDGMELAKKATKHTPDIKVIFITGFSAMAVKQQDNTSQENTKLLSKPFHLNELIDQVIQLLNLPPIEPSAKV